MEYAMVTARMSQGKKESGNAILEQLGTNASSAINQFYDYIIERKTLPFDVREPLTPDEIKRRVELVDGIPLESSDRFLTKSDTEIKRDHVTSRLSRVLL